MMSVPGARARLSSNARTRRVVAMVASVTRERSPAGIGRPDTGGAAHHFWRPPGPARADKCRASNAPQSAPPSHAPGEHLCVRGRRERARRTGDRGQWRCNAPQPPARPLQRALLRARARPRGGAEGLVLRRSALAPEGAEAARGGRRAGAARAAGAAPWLGARAGRRFCHACPGIFQSPRRRGSSAAQLTHASRAR
ncbi:hypothetical protein T492DRAFT_25223 [Pavlovales sp. CCMP2436]|nr:hypothetical protein T492DRAFT_25223 [Pavlovales sp. CCMP2436]